MAFPFLKEGIRAKTEICRKNNGCSIQSPIYHTTFGSGPSTAERAVLRSINASILRFAEPHSVNAADRRPSVSGQDISYPASDHAILGILSIAIP